MRWGAKPAWPELAEDLEVVIMLSAERAVRYDPAWAEEEPWANVTPRQWRRWRHKHRGASQHAHFPDPERPGRILRCQRCRPAPAVPDVTQARVGLSSRWARS